MGGVADPAAFLDELGRPTRDVDDEVGRREPTRTFLVAAPRFEVGREKFFGVSIFLDVVDAFNWNSMLVPVDVGVWLVALL